MIRGARLVAYVREASSLARWRPLAVRDGLYMYLHDKAMRLCTPVVPQTRLRRVGGRCGDRRGGRKARRAEADASAGSQIERSEAGTEDFLVGWHVVEAG